MSSQIVIIAFYRFISLPDFQEIRAILLEKLKELEIKGTILLAEEGINGTISGYQLAIDAIIAYFNQDQRFKNLNYKFSYAKKQPFQKTKVKLRKEIVKLAKESVDPNAAVGEYVSPKNWNQLITNPEVVVIDTRNHYEIAMGTFKGAINPKTRRFHELPQFVAKELDKNKHKKVAMFCTGGVRCEKSTSYLLQQGFENVYHLEGGILNYLEQIPEDKSLWEGECFVFDERVTVKHNLQQGNYEECTDSNHFRKNDGTLVER